MPIESKGSYQKPQTTVCCCKQNRSQSNRGILKADETPHPPGKASQNILHPEQTTLLNQQALLLQRLDIAARIPDRPRSRLAQLPPPITGLLLAPGLRLRTPARRHPTQDLAAIARREIDEADGADGGADGGLGRERRRGFAPMVGRA